MAITERLLSTVLGPWLRRRSRPGLVYSALGELPYELAASPRLPLVRIAVVQYDIGRLESAPAYARRVHGLVRRAVQGGAGLVMFPEYASLPLLGLLPGVRLLAGRLAAGSVDRPEEQADARSQASDVNEVIALAFRLVADAAKRVYLATFAALAARFQVTLLAGSLIELGPAGQLCNVAYLFGVDGGLLARQVKTHLVPSEVSMGYAVGEQIEVVDTPAGRLAFPVCMDHTYFETARVAALQGADLLIDPAANNAYYSPYAQARGIWSRVQEVYTYGVLCSAVGRVAGSVFEGRSGVYAPLGMTPAGDGILAEAETHDREEVVFADLDYAALSRFRRRSPLELNPALYRRYLPVAYRRGARGGAPLRGL